MTQITMEQYIGLNKTLQDFKIRETKILDKLDTAYSMLRGTEQKHYELISQTRRMFEQRIKEQKDIIRYLKRRLSKYENGERDEIEDEKEE
jgi:hypothetical protein